MNASLSWGAIVKRAQAMAKMDGFVLDNLGLIAQAGYFTAAEHEERAFSQRLLNIAFQAGPR